MALLLYQISECSESYISLPVRILNTIMRIRLHYEQCGSVFTKEMNLFDKTCILLPLVIFFYLFQQCPAVRPVLV